MKKCGLFIVVVFLVSSLPVVAEDADYLDSYYRTFDKHKENVLHMMQSGMEQYSDEEQTFLLWLGLHTELVMSKIMHLFDLTIIRDSLQKEHAENVSISTLLETRKGGHMEFFRSMLKELPRFQKGIDNKQIIEAGNAIESDLQEFLQGISK
jgi:cell fate (sporulation/competence/biofilm development) regulator YlbF (YheA/YmcA/DUF963 family)